MTHEIIRSKVTVQPTEEPCTLQEVKDHLRKTTNEDDTYLTTLITTVRVYLEDYTGRKFVTQTINDWRDRFSFTIPWWEGVRDGALTEFQKRVLEIRYLPVQSVTQVSTFDDNDTETVFNSANYQEDSVDEDYAARVILKDGATWPTDLRPANAVKIEYVAGYGLAGDVPGPIRQALKMGAAFMYMNRGACDVESAIRDSGAISLIRQYRIPQL